jgi:hypothetical protein
VRGSRWGGDHSDRPRRGRWSLAEIARLKELYGLKEDEAIAKELGRPVASVRRMAKTLFPGEVTSGPWSEEEVQNLKRYIGVAPEETIAHILGRSVASVMAQIADLSRVVSDREWTQVEIADLKRFYGTRTDEDIARIFGRTEEAVAEKASELCLAKDKAFVRRISGAPATKMPRWSAEEIEQLKKLYGDHSNLEIAKILDRSVKSVVSKAHNLGLKKERVRLAEMGRENVSLRYGRQADGTKDPNIDTSAGPPVTLTPQPRGDMPELEVGGTTLQPAPKPAEKPADKPAPEKASEGDAKSKKQHTEDER